VGRREAQFDAMLRHLGAVYYQALQEEAAAAEVARGAMLSPNSRQAATVAPRSAGAFATGAGGGCAM